MDSSPARFAHQSEATLAKLFDFYQIAWQYEPRSFPIQWDCDGHAVAFFTPDFYLPEHDVYIELTTAKPAMNTRKNRKIRLLRERYPSVRVKLLTRRDAERIFSRLRSAA